MIVRAVARNRGRFSFPWRIPIPRHAVFTVFLTHRALAHAELRNT